MNKSKQISLGAMVTVISLVLMFMASIIPTIKIFLVSLASFLTAVIIIEVGIPAALMSFVSTSILGLIIVPNKIMVLPYALFFGYYGAIKLHIERLNNFILEWIIKLVIFNIVIFIKYLIFINVIVAEINLPFSIWFIVLGLQFVFIIYDYIFSRFIQHYNTNIKKHIQKIT